MFAQIIGTLSGWLYSYILIFLLIGGGLYFTFKTRCIQFKYFGECMRVVGEKPPISGSVTSFHALMVSTASRVGTGNIIGVSTAVCLGGYGAVFWMWIIALVGGASAFIESTLAQIYKRRDENGHFYGGPAYYIEAALKCKPLAVIFAVSLILTYGAGFNMLASYNLQSTFAVYDWYQALSFTMGEETASWAPVLIGAVIASFVFYCLQGGGRRVIAVTSVLVPLMGLIYVAVSLYVVVAHIGLLPGVLGKIIVDAFDFPAIFGGLAGSCLVFGIKRGLYSNEAGVGSAPNAAAAADVSHPVKQGLVQMLSVFIDTLLLCTCTAMMLLCSGVAPNAELAGAPYVQAALRGALGDVGPMIITLAMVLFAFTTLLGNLYYCDNLWIYLNGKRTPGKEFMLGYRIVAAFLIFIGAVISMGLAWDMADVLMGIMALINVPVIILIGGRAIAALQDYAKQRQAGQNPVFKAADIGLTDTECWK